MSKFWDGIAEKYAAKPVSNEAAYAATISRVKTHLTPTSRVLEVGCGTGTTALKLAPFAGSILGTDFSDRMIKICNDKLQAAATHDDKVSNVEFAVGDICRPDGHQASNKGIYDVVLAFNLLYLLDDLPLALRNVNGLLKPGGLFISKNMVQDAVSWTNRLMIGVIPILAWAGWAPRHVVLQSSNELEESIKKSGFELVESIIAKGDEQRRYIVARKTREA